MSMIGLSRSAWASVEEKIYGAQVSLSVYIGMTRASLEGAFPLFQRIPFVSLFAAFIVVFFIQSLIFTLVSVGKIFSILSLLPSLFWGVVAYIPVFNKLA